MQHKSFIVATVALSVSCAWINDNIIRTMKRLILLLMTVLASTCVSAQHHVVPS